MLDKSANRNFFGAIVIVFAGLLVLVLLVRVFAPTRSPSGPGDDADAGEAAGPSVERDVPEDERFEPNEGTEPDAPWMARQPRRPLPKGVIAGRVVGEAGQPVAEAEVAVLMTRYRQDSAEDETARSLKREDLFEATVETGEEGKFEFTGLPEVETVPVGAVRQAREGVTCMLVAQREGYRTTWLDVRPGEYELLVVLEETVAFVSGRVVGADSGGPLAGARVECRSAETRSDENGEFRFEVPIEVGPPQSLKVSVLCYPPELSYAGKELRDVRIVQGEETAGLVFVIEAATGLIEGVVLEGGTREPAAGMRVRLYERDRTRPYFYPDKSHPELVVDAASDGTFVFEAVRAGTYQVEAIKRDWHCVVGRTQVVVDDQPKPVKVNLYVHTTSALVITGVVTGPEGEPVEDAVVWLVQAKRVVYQPASSDAEGRYGLQSYYRPAQSKLSVMVFHPDYELEIAPVGSEQAPGTSEGGEAVRLDVALGRAARLGGVVADKEGRLLKDVTITVEGETLGPAINTYYFYLPNPRVPFATGPDGAYEFTYLPPGEYVVRAAHNNYVITEQTVEVVAGVDRRCDFALDSGATIRGTIYDERGVPLRVRSVVALGADGREYDSTASGGDGRFTLKTLPRDEPVDVLVLADVVDLRSNEPFYYARVQKVQPDQEDLRIDVRVVERGAVELEVVEAGTDRPIARYDVWCVSQPRAGLHGVARRFVTSARYGRANVNDPAGRTTLKRLLPGTHQFTVQANGYRPATSEAVEIVGGGTARLRVELERHEAD